VNGLAYEDPVDRDALSAAGSGGDELRLGGSRGDSGLARESERERDRVPSVAPLASHDSPFAELLYVAGNVELRKCICALSVPLRGTAASSKRAPARNRSNALSDA
jgi:hypothetical protein